MGTIRSGAWGRESRLKLPARRRRCGSLGAHGPGRRWLTYPRSAMFRLVISPRRRRALAPWQLQLNFSVASRSEANCGRTTWDPLSPRRHPGLRPRALASLARRGHQPGWECSAEQRHSRWTPGRAASAAGLAGAQPPRRRPSSGDWPSPAWVATSGPPVAERPRLPTSGLAESAPRRRATQQSGPGVLAPVTHERIFPAIRRASDPSIPPRRRGPSAGSPDASDGESRPQTPGERGLAVLVPTRAGERPQRCPPVAVTCAGQSLVRPPIRLLGHSPAMPNVLEEHGRPRRGWTAGELPGSVAGPDGPGLQVGA